jgi:hypothetical protein
VGGWGIMVEVLRDFADTFLALEEDTAISRHIV